MRRAVTAPRIKQFVSNFFHIYDLRRQQEGTRRANEEDARLIEINNRRSGSVSHVSLATERHISKILQSFSLASSDDRIEASNDIIKTDDSRRVLFWTRSAGRRRLTPAFKKSNTAIIGDAKFESVSKQFVCHRPRCSNRPEI
jgi:hypothetical protein